MTHRGRFFLRHGMLSLIWVESLKFHCQSTDSSSLIGEDRIATSPMFVRFKGTQRHVEASKLIQKRFTLFRKSLVIGIN